MARSTRLLPLLLLGVTGCDDPTQDEAHREASTPCSLDVIEVIQLGSAADPAGPDLYHTAVATDSRGNWYVVPAGAAADVLVYDSAGQYRRSIGRRGQGPGELDGVLHLSMDGDTLWVFSNGRLTAFDADGGHITTRRMPVLGGRSHRTASGDILIHRRGEAPEVVGVRANGTLLRFGPGRVENGWSPGQYFGAAIVSEDSVWFARADQYRLELWTPGGAAARVLERRPPWFQWPLDQQKAIIHDLWVNPAGTLLWVSAAHLWNTRGSDGTGAVAVIEVLDTRTGELIGSDSLSGWPPLNFTDQGDLYRVTEGLAGHTVVHLYHGVLSASASAQTCEASLAGV